VGGDDVSDRASGRFGAAIGGVPHGRHRASAVLELFDN
jgi:hypothetical protein